MDAERQEEEEQERNNVAFVVEEDVKDVKSEKKIVIQPKTYCKLGHFHLLLEDYEKGE